MEALPPPFAHLTAGITTNDLREAISRSGYPFQAVVAESIRNSPLRALQSLEVQEEWSFVDRETGQTRSIDILVDGAFPHGYDEPESKFRTRLNLLVECKQSDLPYIFFLRQTRAKLGIGFPEIAGLDHQKLRIFTHGPNEDEGGDGFSWWVDIRDALSFDELPFFTEPAPYAISLAKAARRGSKLELTGEDAYKSMTLPLLKAADHLISLSGPEPEHPLRFPRLLISLSVIRAPMVAAFLNGEEHELVSLPWVRIGHLEPIKKASEGRDLSGAMRFFDVVHESFLQRYLEVLSRDAWEAALRLHNHSTEVASGLAFADISNDRIDPRPLPEYYNKFLEEPCTITLTQSRHVLGLSVNRPDGVTADPDAANELPWTDDYGWLYPENE